MHKEDFISGACAGLLISPANYGGCDLKLAGRAHSQADYIETCAVRLNGG